MSRARCNDNPVLISINFPIRCCIALHACPCGFYGDPIKPCTCSPGTVTKYQKRISGPLLDRIDLTIHVPAVTAADLVLPPAREGSREAAALAATA